MLLLVVILLAVRTVTACFPLGASPAYYPAPPPPVYNYGAYPAKTRMASPSHTITSNQMDEQNLAFQAGSDCLQKYENQRLDCVSPVERRSQISEEECQQMCEQVQCKSYQFDNMAMTCDVFDTDHTGQPRSPFRDTILNSDEFRKRRKKRTPRTNNAFDEFLRDPLRQMPNGQPATAYCDPTLVPANGITFTMIDEDCKQSIKRGFVKTQPNQFMGSLESFKAEKSRQPQKNPVQMVIPEIPDCPDNSRARVQLVEGVQVVDSTPMTTVQLDSPDQCLQICKLNSHFDGTRFAHACRSAAFDRSTGKCTVYEAAISPNGDLNYQPNTNSIYFEKYCLPANVLALTCDDIVHRIPQHTLDKRAIGTGAVITTATQIECIKQCITSKRRYNFECRAVSYFFDWPAENCYMSRFTRTQRPDIYVPERKELVDYIELATCMHSVRQHDEPTSWSEWSDCDRSFTRTRTRSCEDCDPVNERSPCFGGNQRDEEFEREMEETDPIISQTFDAARRYKPSQIKNIASSEATLFGEQDYDHQSEISFFGPPGQTPNKVREIDNDDAVIQAQPNLFDIRSNIKKIRPEEKARGKPITTTTTSEPFNLAFNEAAPFDPPKSMDLLGTDFDTEEMSSSELSLLRSAQKEAEVEANKMRLRASRSGDSKEKRSKNKEIIMEKTDKTFQDPSKPLADLCNPKVTCCLRENGSRATLKGCVIGYRLHEDGKTSTCLTNECT